MKKLGLTKRLVGLNILTFSFIFLWHWDNITEDKGLGAISTRILNVYLIIATILFIVELVYMGIIVSKESVYEGSILDAIPDKRIIFMLVLDYCVVVISIILDIILLILTKNNSSLSLLNFDTSTYTIAFVFLVSLGIQIYFYSKTKYVLLFPALIFAIELYLILSSNQLIKVLGTPFLILTQLLIATIVIYKNI